MAGIEMIGSAMLTARLLAIPSKLRQSIEKKALTEGNKLVLGTLRQHVPIATGALKQSLTQDIRTYKGGNTLIGRVGAGKDYVKMHKGKRRRPSKYLHIVDRGFEKKENKGKFEGRHFMERTEAQHAAQIRLLFETAVKEALEK